MVNARKHGLFYQNRSNIKQHNKRISLLPSVAGTTLRAHFALLKSCTHKLALYAGRYMPIRILITFCALFTSYSVSAIECELVLTRFVSILVTKGELAENSNISNAEFNNENFETCEVTHKDRNYTLWLHSDNVSIYISSKFKGSNKSIVQGPFYSAYKK
jgi:hypothetical protein